VDLSRVRRLRPHLRDLRRASAPMSDPSRAAPRTRRDRVGAATPGIDSSPARTAIIDSRHPAVVVGAACSRDVPSRARAGRLFSDSVIRAVDVAPPTVCPEVPARPGTRRLCRFNASYAPGPHVLRPRGRSSRRSRSPANACRRSTGSLGIHRAVVYVVAELSITPLTSSHRAHELASSPTRLARCRRRRRSRGRDPPTRG